MTSTEFRRLTAAAAELVAAVDALGRIERATLLDARRELDQALLHLFERLELTLNVGRA